MSNVYTVFHRQQSALYDRSLPGCTCLFTTTTGINLLIMFSVPEVNRPFAIAMNSVFIHALGDVPSPVIVGYLKDMLAPACSGGDDDSISSSPGCRGDEEG